MTLFKKDRFDVEQEIMELGSFSEMIKNYADMLYDGNYKQTEDDIHTTLHGFANLLYAHSDKMFITHKRVFGLDEFRPQPETTKEMDDFFMNIEKDRGNVKENFE